MTLSIYISFANKIYCAKHELNKFQKINSWSELFCSNKTGNITIKSVDTRPIRQKALSRPTFMYYLDFYLPYLFAKVLLDQQYF